MFCLVVLSIVFMALDHPDSYIAEVRNALSVVVAPLQYVVDWPVDIIDWMDTSLATHQALLKENAHLRAKELLLQAQVQKFIALESENRHLRALLQSSSHVAGKVEVAQLLSVASDPFVHQIVLAKGSREGVFVGQPVLDASGVMGQVIRVGLITSRVLLLTDTHSAIPVQINGSGVRAIVIGTGARDSMSLINIPVTTKIHEGDILVTSGLGGRYPAGFPVGAVTSILHKPGAHFATIEIKPSAHLTRSRLVMLVWPSHIKHLKKKSTHA